MLKLRVLGRFVVLTLGRTEFVEGWADVECSARHTASLAYFPSIWLETALKT